MSGAMGSMVRYVVLDLICAHAPPGADPAENDTTCAASYVAGTVAKAKSDARQAGWRLGRRVLCPIHARTQRHRHDD